MKIDLANLSEIIKVNNLQKVTNPILCNKGCIPTEDGLLSTDIFGITSKERENRVAYIDLHGHFFQPAAYKAFKRLNRNIDHVISGTKNFKIENGQLVVDENGETGIKWLYANWDKLKFEKNNSSMRNERIDLLSSHPRDVIFCSSWIVFPAKYRDMNLQKKEASSDAINPIYSKLIRLTQTAASSNNFDFVIHSLQANIQNTLIEIYDYFKQKLEKKNGVIRKALLGKTVDYSARMVITAPKYDFNRPEEMPIGLDTVGIPLSYSCSLFYPFVLHWLRNFFKREFTNRRYRYPVKLDGWKEVKYVELEDPELYFTDEYLKKKIDSFIYSYRTRYDIVEVPVKNKSDVDNNVIGMVFTGRYANSNEPESISNISSRRVTWCDLLYRAAVEVTKDKHVVCTRYPVLDYFGSFCAKIHVMSTHKNKAVYIGDEYYPYYPDIQPGLDSNAISVAFIDTCVMSNLLLGGLGGDYDGDQITVKSIFSQEANKEAAEDMIKSKSNILNINGKCMRRITKEGVEALYQLTRRK